ncbi:hypothetical protein WUBG_14078 [Wuchereria bancrofti]|uniref:Uncharacterized protein n=1 Tax=Wuchereria bancrofti TaxID=6293 RepID=J9EHY3_WUCBA|nr:hypothetical protein WUBG_14078 [Wuchereria bancrofti]
MINKGRNGKLLDSMFSAIITDASSRSSSGTLLERNVSAGQALKSRESSLTVKLEKSKDSEHIESTFIPELTTTLIKELKWKRVVRKSRKQVWILISRIEIKNGTWSLSPAERITWWFDQTFLIARVAFTDNERHEMIFLSWEENFSGGKSGRRTGKVLY